MTLNTVSYLKNLVIVENFFCVGRTHLLENHNTKLICNAIFFTVSIIVTSIVIIDLITVHQNIGIRSFEAIVGIELFLLALGSRMSKFALERLDEKCRIDEEFAPKVQAKTRQILVLTLLSVIIDFMGLTMLGVKCSIAVFLCVAFAAHDAEMAFVSIMVESLNVRLEKSKSLMPDAGSRVYRHVLMATAHLSEQYTLTILLLLDICLLTTIAYEFILVLHNIERILHASLYIAWREARSMYSLWLLCSAMARTHSICTELELHLVGRLIQEETISKENNPIQYKIVKRWYSVVVAQRPQYISGSVLAMGLRTPILVLDLSINYMLIVVQLYLAYK